MAGTAAYFAIVGIMSIFVGTPIAALVMGTVIEAGKVVGVSWIYRYWNERTTLKYAMIPLVLIAMMLTSMGIFGMLSKSFIEQNAPVGNNAAQIERLDQRVARERSKITDAETIILQLDDTVRTLIEYDKISGPDGARAVREGQEEQRAQLATLIDNAEDRISEYEDEKFTLSQELRQLELEVGPVKYIAELIYEDPTSQIEDAVRIVIIAFIFVFDPMAILLLMAANFTFIQRKPTRTLPDDSYELEDPLVASSADDDVPGKDLINLIDADEYEPEPDREPDSPKPISKTKNSSRDREWLKSIPKKDEDVDGETLIKVIQTLKNRDRTSDEQALLNRFRKLATSRNIPWNVASRASVSTKNSLLKD